MLIGSIGLKPENQWWKIRWKKMSNSIKKKNNTKLTPFYKEF
jgi:hypothetical protein